MNKKGLDFSWILIFLPNLSPDNSVSLSRVMLPACEEQGRERFSCQVESENFSLQQAINIWLPTGAAELSICNSACCLQGTICLLSTVGISCVFDLLKFVAGRRDQKGDDDSGS